MEELTDFCTVYASKYCNDLNCENCPFYSGNQFKEWFREYIKIKLTNHSV